MSGALPQLLEQSRRRHADRIAVEDVRTSSTLTYRQLGERADAIGGALVRSGVGGGDRVGLCAPKSLTSVAAIHGILSIGAAYVPTDVSAPAMRNATIFADCEVKAIIASSREIDNLRSALGKSLEVVGLLDDDLLIVRGFESATHTTESSLAYILYTSGSTGKPKGVMHTHASARAFIDWSSATFEPVPDDRFSSHAPFHFDLSILDLFVSAAAGAAVVLIGEETGKQPLLLAELIERQRITIWYSTPSTLRMLATYGKLERRDHSSIRLVLFAGEVFPAAPLSELRSRWPGPRYFNLYGPTETNVCTYYELPRETDTNAMAPSPIGRACAGDIARVVDTNDDDVTIGAEGELCISGPTVMTGYWNLPDRATESFLMDRDGTRWYRTGDIVRESESHGYDFVGRRDRMVKRRGYRVELAEIETALCSHPRIADAAVTAVPDAESGVRLDAMLVASGDGRPSIVDMKQYCAANLPMYMVPDRFTFRDSIPQTSTGKVDYQRLRNELT